MPKKINIQKHQDALQEILGQNMNQLQAKDDIRNYIKDSIDLGEVLASLGLEIDLMAFTEVQTVEDFLKVVNSL